MKPNCKKYKALIIDEKQASKEYRKYRFMGLSKDESRHKRFLEKKYKKQCK